jgi:predicted transcriptional regulator
MKVFFALFITLFFSTTGFSQIAIVKNGKAVGRIIVDKTSATDIKAASLLNLFVNKITDTSLPVVTSGNKSKAGDIIIQSLNSDNI